MSAASRQGARVELGQILVQRLTSASAVYTEQPATFGGESPVVVVTSAGTAREGAAKRTFGGPVAPTFYFDVFVFVATMIRDGAGALTTNPDADDQLDTLEAAVAATVAAHAQATTWTAIGHADRTETDFVTVLDGTEYKRERIPLALTGKP